MSKLINLASVLGCRVSDLVGPLDDAILPKAAGNSICESAILADVDELLATYQKVSPAMQTALMSMIESLVNGG